MAPRQAITRTQYVYSLMAVRHGITVKLPEDLKAAGEWTVSYNGDYRLAWKNATDLTRLREATIAMETMEGDDEKPVDLLEQMRAAKSGATRGVVSYEKQNKAILHLQLEWIAGEGLSAEEIDHFGRLASSFSAALSFRQPHDVRLAFPGGRELYSHSALLKTTPFFADLLSSDFAEGQRKSKGEKTKRVQATKGAFIDSDDEENLSEDDAPSISETLGSRSAFNEIVISESSHLTYKALLVYLGTGYPFAFGPLTSSCHRDRSIAQPRRTAAILKLQDPKSLLPYPCSPKSLYRLAHLHSMPELCKLALINYAEQLTSENAAIELFSDVTAAYDEVADVVVEFVAAHWKEVQETEGWKAKKREVDGGGELATRVAVKLMERLQGCQ